MNITRIKYFLHLAQSLNFSETARVHRISQPALSKAIKRLEEEIGDALVRREGRLTHLTPLGRIMQDKLREVEKATREAESAAHRMVAGGSQRLNIAVMCTISPKRLVPFVAELRRSNANIEMDLDDVPADKISEMLLAGDCDLALLASPYGQEPRLRHVELYREAMMIASSHQHRFAGREAVALTDLEHECYIDRLHCEFREMFNDHLSNAGLTLEIAFSAQREDWVYEGIAANIGVALLPEDSVDPERHSACQVAPEPMWRTVSLAVATGREDNDAVRNVLRAARQYDWDTVRESGVQA